MCWVAILFLAVCTAAVGQDTSSGSTAKKSGTKTGAVPDAQFAAKAAQGNMAEVALGKLATEKSQNDDVKKFGQMMVKDHIKDVAEFKKEAASTSANSDLKDFATRTSPTLDNHLTQAKALHDSINKSGANKAAGKSKKKNTAGTTSGGAGLNLI